tara:strand:- start:13272 stop:13964 length:693 start_codon:yes stop_codon:yes gene_type:complete
MSTLSELRTRARRLADAVGNNFFPDAEVNDYINSGLGELHDILVSKFEDYYVSSATFSLANGTSTYSLAGIGISDLYKILGVDIIQGSDTIRVPRYSFTERNVFSSNSALHGGRGFAHYRYNLNGTNITFTPEPNSTDSVKIWYVPSCTKLASDGATVDGSIELNWEEYAVVFAALKMRTKEETSTTSLERELGRLTARIEEASRNRDAGEPMGITDENAGTLSSHWLYG